MGLAKRLTAPLRRLRKVFPDRPKRRYDLVGEAIAKAFGGTAHRASPRHQAAREHNSESEHESRHSRNNKPDPDDEGNHRDNG